MKTPAWVVTAVTPHNNYTLTITFANGDVKVYDASPLLDIPLYAPLKNPVFFLSAKVAFDTVVWNDDIDIAPEHLFEKAVPVNNADTKRAVI